MAVMSAAAAAAPPPVMMRGRRRRRQHGRGFFDLLGPLVAGGRAGGRLPVVLDQLGLNVDGDRDVDRPRSLAGEDGEGAGHEVRYVGGAIGGGGEGGEGRARLLSAQ